MEKRAVITLLTDFGLSDAYVGTMKGVIAGIAPDAHVIDISHEVPPQDVRRAGILWASAVPYFPRGTIHVAVVDPGVGTRRRILAVEGRGFIFLAPDNGLLGHVLRRNPSRRVVSVSASRHFLPRVSSTFHGRDIFAPVAARLALGLPLEALGRPCSPSAWDELPRPRSRSVREGRLLLMEDRGEVVHVDRFGNAVTNLRPRPGWCFVRARAGRLEADVLYAAYGAVASGASLVLVGSSGHVELAVNRGRADELLGLRIGTPVSVFWRRPRAGRLPTPSARGRGCPGSRGSGSP